MALSFIRNQLIRHLNLEHKLTNKEKKLIKCGLKEPLSVYTIRKQIIILKSIARFFKMILTQIGYI